MIRLTVTQIHTNQTPFRYKFSGESLLHGLIVDYLPEGVRIGSYRGANLFSLTLSYDEYEKWFKDVKQAIADDSKTMMIDSPRHGETKRFLRFYTSTKNSPTNTLYVDGLALIAGRIAELKPLFDILEIGLFMNSFLHNATRSLRITVDFFEDRYGSYEDHHCPHCGNAYDENGSECAYCWECPSCHAWHAHDGMVCDHCGYNRELE